MPVLIHFHDKPALYRYSSILHRYVYTHIYTYLCTYIYFPEGMFTYFYPSNASIDLVQGTEDTSRYPWELAGFNPPEASCVWQQKIQGRSMFV